MDIGTRLKNERERLGYSQTDFAALGGAGRKTQFNYETGERFPDAAYLAAIAAVGADVQYIVTGVRSSAALTPEEHLLMKRYRASPPALRDAALRVLLGGELPQAESTKTVVVSVSGEGNKAAGRNFYERENNDERKAADKRRGRGGK